MRIASEFGFTPASRSRISTPAPPDGAFSPFSTIHQTSRELTNDIGRFLVTRFQFQFQASRRLWLDFVERVPKSSGDSMAHEHQNCFDFCGIAHSSNDACD
jgi:hypothetical protein